MKASTLRDRYLARSLSNRHVSTMPWMLDAGAQVACSRCKVRMNRSRCLRHILPDPRRTIQESLNPSTSGLVSGFSFGTVGLRVQDPPADTRNQRTSKPRLLAQGFSRKGSVGSGLRGLVFLTDWPLAASRETLASKKEWSATSVTFCIKAPT